MADCIVCFTEFSTEGPAVPYVLRCGHSICANCSENDRLKTCPTCRVPIREMTKNFALIGMIDTLSLKGKMEESAVCSECNSSIAQEERIRVCISCSTLKDADWMDQMGAIVKVSNYYLCGFCIVENHFGAFHCVKKISEVENLVDAKVHRRYLEKGFDSSVREFQNLSWTMNGTFASFLTAMNAAISKLEKEGSDDTGFHTSAEIADANGTTISHLTYVVRALRELKETVERKTADVNAHLTSKKTLPKFSHREQIDLRNVMNWDLSIILRL